MEEAQPQLAACAVTDAQDFTGVAEGMDPSRVVDFVNGYLRELFAAVLENGGRVVDVKGDGMLAVWTGEPPDATLRSRVCAACLRMAKARRLPTRIGVDFGPIALAPVGAFARYEYRAVGDTVNTGSRLEQLNKLLGTRLLVSGALAEGVEDYLFRDLGEFMLRGKRSPVRVLELLGERSRASRDQRQLVRRFAAARETYESGRVDEARPQFSALSAAFPHDGATRFFLQRCLVGQLGAALALA